MSGSPPQQPAIRVSMWLLGLCVIAVMEVDGFGYGVLQTAAVLAPDTYVEIVRVEERSLLAEHFERLSPTNMRDFGPVTPSEVVKRGELWSASYDDDYGFIVQMANGWVVAGLGSDAVEVGYDTTSNRAASAAQLEEKFGLRSP